MLGLGRDTHELKIVMVVYVCARLNQSTLREGAGLVGPCPEDKNGGRELLGGWDITVFSDVAAVELPNALAGSSTLTPMEVTLVKPSGSQRKQKERRVAGV